MKNATQILESKGYTLEEANDIINCGYREEESLDLQTKTEFEFENEPVHLLEKYTLGDANETTLNQIAIEKGFADYNELLDKATEHLNQLANDFPKKKISVSVKTYNSNADVYFLINDELEDRISVDLTIDSLYFLEDETEDEAIEATKKGIKEEIVDKINEIIYDNNLKGIEIDNDSVDKVVNTLMIDFSAKIHDYFASQKEE